MKKLSIIIVFYEMRREAARTLFTLTRPYQRKCESLDYEVIAIDNGSVRAPLTDEFASTFGPNFRLIRLDPASPSPARACNIGAASCTGDVIMMLIDGARMLSPGILHYATRTFDAYSNAFLHTIGMHLGPKPQNLSMLEGYDQQVEDRILATVDWRANGYSLFGLSSLALSSKDGMLSDVNESNCFAMKRQAYLDLGGFDENFVSPGGGLVNLDFFNRVMECGDIEPVRLVGEATFHQFHGGVATNVPLTRHPFAGFAAEYTAIRGRDYRPVVRPFQMIGHWPPECRNLMTAAAASPA